MSPARRMNESSEERKLLHEQTLADYVALRAEWTGFRNTTMVLFSVSIAVHGVVITVLANVGTLPHGQLIAAAAPLVSWLVLGQYVQNGVDATLRGFYGRAVERSLITGHPGRLPLTLTDKEIDDAIHQTDKDGSRVLPAPLLFHLTHPLGSPKRQLRPLQAQTALGMIVLAVLTVGETVLFLLAAKNVPMAVVAGVVYLAFAVIDIKVLLLALRGERLWAYVIDQLDSGLRRPLDPTKMISVRFDQDGHPNLKPGRSIPRLLGFVVVPRPFEFLQKGLLVFVGSLLFAALAERSGPLGTKTGLILLSFTAFELLIYQGRYLANDINGRRLDTADPTRGGSRIPDEITQPVAIGIAVAHLALGTLLVGYLATREGDRVVGQWAAIAAMVVATIAYEVIRHRCDIGATKRDWLVAASLAVLIGTGYAARGVFGLSTAYAALGVDPPGGALEFGAAYMAAIGAGAVLGAWMLSATGYRHRGRPNDPPLEPLDLERRPYISAFRGVLQPGQNDPDQAILRDAGAPRRIMAASCALATGLAAGCGHAMAHESGQQVAASALLLGVLAAAGIGLALPWFRGFGLLLAGWVMVGVVAGDLGSVVSLLVALMPWSTFWAVQQMSVSSMYKLGHRLDWAGREATTESIAGRQKPRTGAANGSSKRVNGARPTNGRRRSTDARH